MPSNREKACAYYRDQDLRLLTVDCHDGSIQPYVVEAIVRGFEQMYRVTLLDGVWSCTGDPDTADCAHRAAIQMVTGYKSSAAKESASRELVRGGRR